jgi:hypothetical protein
MHSGSPSGICGEVASIASTKEFAFPASAEILRST